MRGKEAARRAGGKEAQENTENGGQEASFVHSSIGDWLLPAAGIRGSRQNGGGQGGEHPPRP